MHTERDIPLEHGASPIKSQLLLPLYGVMGVRLTPSRLMLIKLINEEMIKVFVMSENISLKFIKVSIQRTYTVDCVSWSSTDDVEIPRKLVCGL